MFIKIQPNRKSIKKRSLVFGVGVNDASYMVQPRINGKTLPCLFYSRWTTMLSRCYSKRVHKRYPTYIGCTVCDEWLLFSNFSRWMKSQDWKNKHLDKDILVSGNKIYSPEFCLFVSNDINNLLKTNNNRSSANYMSGVSKIVTGGKFRAHCSDGKGAKIYLGSFENEEDAHKAYCNYKYGIISEIAKKQSEPLKSALLKYKIR